MSHIADYISSGQGRSDNAELAELEGKLPMSRAIPVLAERANVTHDRARQALLKTWDGEWHHTGIRAQRTDYYDVAAAWAWLNDPAAQAKSETETQARIEKIREENRTRDDAISAAPAKLLAAGFAPHAEGSCTFDDSRNRIEPKFFGRWIQTVGEYTVTAWIDGEGGTPGRVYVPEQPSSAAGKNHDREWYYVAYAIDAVAQLAAGKTPDALAKIIACRKTRESSWVAQDRQKKQAAIDLENTWRQIRAELEAMDYPMTIEITPPTYDTSYLHARFEVSGFACRAQIYSGHIENVGVASRAVGDAIKAVVARSRWNRASVRVNDSEVFTNEKAKFLSGVRFPLPKFAGNIAEYATAMLALPTDLEIEATVKSLRDARIAKK